MRATGKSQLAPLHVSLSDGRKFRKRHVTQIYINPKAWDNRSVSLKKRYPWDEQEKLRINTEMYDLKMFISKAYLADKQSGAIRDDWLKIHIAKYYGNNDSIAKPVEVTLNDVFHKFLTTRDIGKERKRLYNRIFQMLAHYEKVSGTSAMNIKPHDLERLYQSAAHQQDMSFGHRSGNYMCLIFKALRVFYNWCMKMGFMKCSPFADFKIPAEVYGSPVYLDKDDIGKVIKADLSSYPSLEVQRDIFVFQCNVGCRVGDMVCLQKKDIVKGVLAYIPRKTIKTAPKTVTVPLNRIAQSIIEKYKNVHGEQLLPFITPRNYNRAIKRILTIAGVDHLVTKLDPRSGKEVKIPINMIAGSHMARRTFIGNIYKTVKDPALVSSMTGHSEDSRVFCRYREIDIDMKREMVRTLEM